MARLAFQSPTRYQHTSNAFAMRARHAAGSNYYLNIGDNIAS